VGYLSQEAGHGGEGSLTIRKEKCIIKKSLEAQTLPARLTESQGKSVIYKVLKKLK